MAELTERQQRKLERGNQIRAATERNRLARENRTVWQKVDGLDWFLYAWLASLATIIILFGVEIHNYQPNYCNDYQLEQPGLISRETVGKGHQNIWKNFEQGPSCLVR